MAPRPSCQDDSIDRNIFTPVAALTSRLREGGLKSRFPNQTRQTSRQPMPRVKTEGDVYRNYPPKDQKEIRKSFTPSSVSPSPGSQPLREFFGGILHVGRHSHVRGLSQPTTPSLGDPTDTDTRTKRITKMGKRCRDYMWKLLRILIAPIHMICGVSIMGWAVARVAYVKVIGAAKRRTIRYWILQKIPLLKVIIDYHRSLWSANSFTKSPPPYTRGEVVRSLIGEFVAGIVEAIMAFPQSMSYSMLATLPPVNGLYNQAIFPFLFAPFTAAPSIAVGVSAIENLMAGDAITRVLGKVGTAAERVNCASALGLVMGTMLFLMYFCRLGVISSLLPDPVIEGFSTASAFVIGITQLKYALGLSDVPSTLTPMGMIIHCFQRLDETNTTCLMISGIGIVILTIFKKLNHRWPKVPFPGPLIVVIGGILITIWCDLDKSPHNVPVVGNIASGLPKFTVPKFHLGHHDENDMTCPKFWDVLQEGALLALLYFIVHVSVSRTISFKTGKEVIPNQELLALSITNIGGSFFETFPNATSISRTSVVTSLGSRTAIHSLVSASLVLLVVQVATSLFAKLPYACLASIVLSGVTGMVSFKDLKSLYVHQLNILRLMCYEKSNDTPLVCPDFLLWCTAFSVTVTIGALEGILFSLALSVTLIIAGYSRPPTAILGRLPGCNIFRNVRRFPMAQLYEGVTILRFDASLNFSNADFFRSMLVTEVGRLLTRGVPINKLREKDCGPALSRTISNTQREFISDQLANGVVAHIEDTSKITDSLEIDDAIRNDWCYPPVIIIDASSMNELDLTAVRMLEKIVPDIEKRGVLLLLANWKGPVRDFLDFCDFYRTLPPDRCFLGSYDAVMTALNYQHHLSRLVFRNEIIPHAQRVYGDWTNGGTDDPHHLRATPILPDKDDLAPPHEGVNDHVAVIQINTPTRTPRKNMDEVIIIPETTPGGLQRRSPHHRNIDAMELTGSSPVAGGHTSVFQLQ